MGGLDCWTTTPATGADTTHGFMGFPKSLGLLTRQLADRLPTELAGVAISVELSLALE